MLSEDKNIEYEILNRLDDKSLVNYCRLNKTSRQVCEDDYFWLSRIVNRFFYINGEILRNYKKDRSWAQYYIEDLRVFNNRFKNHDPNDLLLDSSKGKRLDHVMITLNNGANINHQSKSGWTALMYASYYRDLNIVKYLVEKGAEINYQTNIGWTALMLVSWIGDLNIVEYLIKEGANINQRSNNGRTTLMLASESGHLNIVEYLVENGVNINHKNNDGDTALMLAQKYEHPDIVKYLEEKEEN